MVYNPTMRQQIKTLMSAERALDEIGIFLLDNGCGKEAVIVAEAMVQVCKKASKLRSSKEYYKEIGI
jgi:hypothetical protein